MNSFWKTIPWGAVAMVVILLAWMAARDAHASADLTKKYNCMACHAEATKKVGPAYRDVAKKYSGVAGDTVGALAAKIRKGGSGQWGPIPMPPHPQVSEADARAMATYILGLK
jgi:cytochrome c